METEIPQSDALGRVERVKTKKHLRLLGHLLFYKTHIH